MPIASFDDFCECIFELAGFGEPCVVPERDGTRSATMHLRGVAVTAVELPSSRGHYAFLAAQIDAPGENIDEAAAACLALLDANSVLPDVNSPRFGRNPLTGDVTMQWPCALQEISPLDAYQRASHMADVVLHWQRHRRVHPQLLSPGRGAAGTSALDGDAAVDAAWRFRDLYLALCDVLGQPAQPGPPGMQAFSFAVHFQDVQVVMAHLPQLRPHVALVGVPLGRREPGDQANAEAMAMMDANFVLASQPHGAAFCRDPASGELLLRYAYPLEGACGRHCLDQMANLARFAREWGASVMQQDSTVTAPVAPMLAGALA